MIRDLVYYREHLANLDPQDDLQKYSFCLGYFTHLICDILWSKYILAATKTLCKEMIEKDALEAWGIIKDDWYGLDQRYNRAHPEGLFWQVIHKTPYPPSHLEFIKEKPLYQQLDHIRKFYSEPDPLFFVERKYPYLNEATMSRTVDDTVKSTLYIIDQLQQTEFDHLESSSKLLPLEFMRPYELPLGDV